MMTKEQIVQLARPLLVKWITRGILWLLTAKLGMDALSAQTTGGEIANGIAAAACVAIGLLIDRWHHKRDLAEQPK